MVVGRSNKDYRRWEYEDEETEMNVEETLSLEGNDEMGEEVMVLDESGRRNTTSTFVHPTATMTTMSSTSSRNSHHHHHHHHLTHNNRLHGIHNASRRSRVSKSLSSRKLHV